MTQGDLLNTKKKYYVCDNCQMMFAEAVAKDKDFKCHACGGRIRERGE